MPQTDLTEDATIDMVVVNYKTPEDLDHFLLSLMFNTSEEDMDRMKSITIVNVDPEATDIKIAHDYAFSLSSILGMDVHTLNMPWNCGYAIACNRGAQFGSSEVVAFFNADTMLRSGVVDGCVRAFIDNAHWGIVGPKQVDDENRITHAGIFGPDNKPQLRGWKEHGDKYDDVRDDCYSVSGSAYFVRRALWDELRFCPIFIESCNGINGEYGDGAFLPTPHYYEETYLSVHARKHGWKIAYLGNLEMVHRWHKASAVGGKADKLFPKSREIFRKACREHGMVHD